MSKAAVLVTASKLSEQAQQILREGGAEVIFMQDPITEDALAAKLAEGIDAVVLRGSPPITRRVLEGAKNLKMIAKHGAGVDSVDLEAATARGVVVVTAGGANADAVAEQTLALMLSLVRELPRLDRNIKKGLWEKPQFLGRELRGRTVGIVGYGAIGRRVARLAQAFGAHIVVFSRSRVADADGARVEENFDRLLGAVDILSLHCPLTEKTRGLIGACELGLMKRDALLINTARGAVIDETALYDALKNGRLAGAALETFAKEPVDPKNPLLTLDNVLATPHVAAITQETTVRLGTVTAQQIVDFLKTGAYTRANLVNPAVLK